MSNTPSQARPMDWMVNSRVAGLAVLVVGGGSGMGEATALTFAANGGLVAVADLDEAGAGRVAAQVLAAGGRAVAMKLDVTEQADIDAGVARTVAEFGKLDVLINTSALVRPELLEDGPMDIWTRCFQTNVDGALMLARACLPHLRRSPAAAIVNVSSLAGEHGYARGGAYGPSKAALTTLSRQMGLEWAADGIRVNVVMPGTIDTPMSRRSVRPEMLADRAAKQIPISRLGLASEVADLIVFLASPAASFITAQAIACDGGLSESMFMAQMGGVTAPPPGVGRP